MSTKNVIMSSENQQKAEGSLIEVEPLAVNQDMAALVPIMKCSYIV